jgi:ubiquinone/menaquinone biosynthesis C-methylase UbiE
MYNTFARVYDRIMCDTADYDRVFKRFQTAIKRNKSAPGNILLDLGCGTGELTRRFAACFDVIAADISEDCLSIAMEKGADTPNEDNIRYIRQDARELDLYGTVDVTVAAFDVMNHFLTVEDLRKVMKRVSLFTAPGGVFIFDYNTTYKHSKTLGNHTFVYDYGEFTCIWENSYHGANAKVHMHITVFERGTDNPNLFTRFDEDITESSLQPERIIKLLSECGFDAVYETFESDGETHEPERLLFTARKA